ncbi:MAG: hypothetical protein CVV27_08915 [Candidatus Melainabacteria bacterium HGW-Melainabacteria-1]|nr:MAG: hypothetical protein CVV27_08915 [Candidatus Melainabacteria bacterium HGW-Melainabacteria-1]
MTPEVATPLVSPQPTSAPPIAIVATPVPALILPPSSSQSASVPPLASPALNELSLSRSQYSAGESITVSFRIDPALSHDQTAWIGIVPADVPHGSESENDKYDLSFQYLEGKAQGEMSFVAPETPGNYDLRLHTSDSNGLEIAHVNFSVSGPVKPISGNALVLDKSRYLPGETIIVTVSIKAEDKRDESAWVGLLPSVIEHGDEALNDRHHLAYQYMGKYLSGKMRFEAPKVPGFYDLRLHDSDDNGRELVYVSFVVDSP